MTGTQLYKIEKYLNDIPTKSVVVYYEGDYFRVSIDNYKDYPEYFLEWFYNKFVKGEGNE